MQGKAHFLFGTLTGIATATIFAETLNTSASAICLISGSAIGALLPDIDNPSSTIGCRFPIFSRVINKIFGHRNFIHSILNVLLISLAGYIAYKNNWLEFIAFLMLLIANLKLFKGIGIIKRVVLTIIVFSLLPYTFEGLLYFPIGLLMGIIGHIFCDLFTTQGVKLFYPSDKSISLRSVNSGALSEFVYVIVFSVIYYFTIKLIV